jgi:hypothetical protein
MKPLTWSEFTRIFIAALITAVLISIVWDNYSHASSDWYSHVPVMLEPNTQMSP